MLITPLCGGLQAIEHLHQRTHGLLITSRSWAPGAEAIAQCRRLDTAGW